MTRQEAIKILDKYDLNFCDIDGNPIPPQDLAEAFDMAIEALEQETVSRETYTHEYCLRKEFEMKVFELEKKMAEQEPSEGGTRMESEEEIVQCEDAINRYSALAVLHPCSVEYKEIKALPSVLIKSPKQEVEEDRLRWIPVSERLPSEPFGCLVTVWDSTPTGEGDDFENILPYFVGWDGKRWNDEDGEQCPFEIVAWMPLPEPYKECEEE